MKQIPDGKRKLLNVGDLRQIVNSLEEYPDDTRVLFRDRDYYEYNIMVQPTKCDSEDKDMEGKLLFNSVEFYVMD